MANKVTIKVVSQRISLEYHGTASKSTLVAASKMAALLNAKSDSGKPVAKPQDKSSTSYTLYASSVTNRTDGTTPEDVGPLVFAFEPVIDKFMKYQDAAAARRRKDFFTAVEAGKKALQEKYGNRIPNEALLQLAKDMKSKSCTLFKHQIITTRSDDSSFPGSRRNRDGVYSASAKSKTIYTDKPLTEAQLEQLKQLLLSEKISEGKLATRDTRVAVPGFKAAFLSRTGAIIMKELSVTSASGDNGPPGRS